MLTTGVNLVTEIAPTAVVDKTAQLADDIIVGPGCVIGPNTIIGTGCILKANVIIGAGVTLGNNNRIFPNCVLGEEPQIIGTVEPQTELIIGNNNTFREHVTINRGSPRGNGKTIIGNNNYLMISAHLGHDCEIEDNCVLGNSVALAGHCKVEKNAWLSAFSTMQQFATVGRLTFSAGFSGIYIDQPPFVRVSGYPCRVRGLNVIGLQRAGFSEESITALKKVFLRLFRKSGSETLAHAVEELSAQDSQDENVRYLLESLRRRNQHHLGRYLESFRH
jgi:UDP-N-acetylglucosamine acyltransferase